MVQTGNEISYDMLWGCPNGTLYQCRPSSSTSNWNCFEKLLAQTTKATCDACPETKIILHVERVSTSQQKGYYNLLGQCTSHPRHGVFIRQGKKTVIR
ncbi:glycosyl hydrolase 53 family protein [Hallella multisaccharivorax]|uniref:glycosyl hydrolase 53 family protein n=1 Tax=Hallella multisaccharivorax TaxID=310514 RepID=UPI00361FBB4F